MKRKKEEVADILKIKEQEAKAEIDKIVRIKKDYDKHAKEDAAAKKDEPQ